MTISLETVSKYTRQNTGRHFLDSGDHYGRIYDKPLSKNLAVMDGDYGAVISVTHLLSEFAEIHPLHKQFYKYANRPEHEREPWFELGDSFMRERGYTQSCRDNTCNGDNDFDQEFVYEIWTPEYSGSDDYLYDDDAVVLIYAHTGCDVRGGYASPMIVTFPSCEYTMPFDFQCSLYSSELDDDENERLQVGYSGYPIGQLEEMGFKLDEKKQESTGADDSAWFINDDGKSIEVFADYTGCY